jgi:hypothetical protein
MAEELSLDGIKDMKKAEFIKAFKNKAAWKKAKAVIFLVDYKLEGKKAVIAIPFKKENEMKLEMKRLKKEKLHLLKKSGGGTIVIDKNADGDREATIELIMGGLKLELLQLKATPLFEKIKVKLSATQTGEALEDAAAAESEVDTTENLPEDNLDDVDADADEGEEDNEGETASSETEKASAPNPKKEAQKKDLAAKIALMKENVGKMEKVVGTTSKEKLEPNVLKYEAALEQLTKAAQADGVIEKEEQASIDELKTALENLRKSMDENNATPQGKKLTEEQKDKIKENMTKISARLDAIVTKLGL